MTDPLPVARMRAVFVMREPFAPQEMLGPMLRGAFGAALRRRHPLLFLSIFGGSNRGAPETQTPRPYRLRTAYGPHRTLEPGEAFSVRFDLFGDAVVHTPVIAEAWQLAGLAGFGLDRARADLALVLQTPSLTLRDTPTGPVLWECRSPGMVKVGRRLGPPAPEAGLRSALLRLRALGGPTAGPLPPVPHQEVSLVRQGFDRWSRRQGKTRLEGYFGAWTANLPNEPVVRLATWAAVNLGVGRHTAFGFGDVRAIPTRD